GDRHLGPITAVPVVLLSGLMGFAPGALAGSIFPKPHPEGTQSRGKQWRKSAIIGGVAGVVTMNLLFSAIGADASVEPRLKLSLIGGGSGFLWGAFMGLLQPAIADNPETVK